MLNTAEIYRMSFGPGGYQGTFTRGKNMAEIVEMIVGLGPGKRLALSRNDVRLEFGDGEAGLVALTEVAQDHNCAVEAGDSTTVTIAKYSGVLVSGALE